MAEECVSVYFEDGTSWSYCWEDVTPYPGWDYENVTTGLRASTTKGARAWRTCQYYLKGMPAVCSSWSVGGPLGYHCGYMNDNAEENPLNPQPVEPTAFNFGNCDFLGRSGWCSNYEAGGTYDPEEWICTAPNPYLTGLGTKTMDGKTVVQRPIAREDIWGYNDDGQGVGQCDCHGWGRGVDGCSIVGGGDEGGDSSEDIEEKLSQLHIVCNRYRPYQMGFGIISPSLKLPGDLEADGQTITDQGWQRAIEWEKNVEYRLPLSFELYNERARLQKCQWWKEDSARRYGVDSTGTNIYLEGDPDIFDEGGKVEFCECPFSESNDFNTRILEDEEAGGGDGWITGAQMALAGVWAKGGGPVCNGARPECPYYSGKWIHLTGQKMLAGMPVTANQVLELRFWSSEWDSQKDYDDYFTIKPNFDDPPTPAIYTFSKWVKQDEEAGAAGEALAAVDVTKSKMLGKKIWLCQPAPLHQREFTRDYVISEDVEYWHAQIGTSTEDEQRHFPNLVRNSAFPDVKPITVIYPPYNNDYFVDEICKEQGEPGYIKRSSNMYGDYIKTIGQTLNTKKVYVINTAKIPIGGPINYFPGIYAIRAGNVFERPAETIKNDIYNSLREAISRGLKDWPDYIKTTVSDDDFGFFITNKVKLIYNEDNKLLIAIDQGDGTWEYRWRLVLSRWYGGVIKQTSYEHIYEDNATGWRNKVPQEIYPGGKAEAAIIPLGGTKESPYDPDVLSTFSLDDIYRGLRYFAYSYEVVEEEEVEEEHWAAVGNTNKIFLELQDTNINYIYDWTIVSASLNYLLDPENLPTGIPVEIPLEKLLEDDNHIGAAMAVFEPEDKEIRVKFVNSEWQLLVTYRYTKLTNNPTRDGNIIYGGGKDELNIFNPGPHTVTGHGSSLTVTNISKGSPQVMAHFKDENERIICAFATKLLVNIVREVCRPIDIDYRYSAEGRQYKLMPEGGFCIDIKQDIAMPDPYKHVSVPACGDHEGSLWYKWQGPLWFPYNVCRGYDMYDEFTICNNCQAGVRGPDNSGVARTPEGAPIYVGGGTVLKRNDYRYCGPVKYDAFGDVRGNWAAACDCGCRFWYSDASAATVVFDGRVRKRTSVDLALYAAKGWYPPPFGNEGREIVEKYISQDYVTHLIPFIINGQLQRADWMPLMMDHQGFFATFNAYDENPEDEYVGIGGEQGFEPFRYVHQLTMGLNVAISEQMTAEETAEGEPTGTEQRYNWEDLFILHHEGNCSYPLPTYPIGTIATKAIHYYLKPEWAAWAWQEPWKDIERNYDSPLPETPPEEGEVTPGASRVIDVGWLNFLDIENPPYIWDYHKTEHRRTVEEGLHDIVFTGPEMDEEGNITKYPTLSIDGAHPRSFEIIYPEDSYIATNKVEWNNEGGQSDTQGSAAEDNIYEDTLGGDWLNDEDIIFSNEASDDTEEAKEDGREVVTGVDPFAGINQGYTYKYFNRGLIIKMTRDRLYNLPKEEDSLGLTIGDADVSEDTTDAGGIPGSYVWDVSSLSMTWLLDEPTSFSRIVVNGSWGYVDGLNTADPPRPAKHEVVRPGVTVTCTFSDDTTGTPRGLTQASTYSTSPEDGQEVEEFQIYMDFLLGPIEMIKKKATSITLSFKGDDDAFISLEEVDFYSVRYVNIRYENIMVHERKYRASEFTDIGNQGINLDGPWEGLKYQEDLLNMGQYFPFRSGEWRTKEVIAMDKTKVVSCGVYHPDDEDIAGVSYDNLQNVEDKEQRDLYEYAYNLDPSSDTTIYASKAPYRFDSFLTSIGERWPSVDLNVNSEKLPFERHERFKQFKQYDFWRPGGHFYTWDSQFRREKCMLFGPAEDVFSGYYAHVDHQGIGTPLEANASRPIDPGNSYYSLRFYVQQAKYDRQLILGGGEPEYTDKWGLGGGVAASTFVR